MHLISPDFYLKTLFLSFSARQLVIHHHHVRAEIARDRFQRLEHPHRDGQRVVFKEQSHTLQTTHLRIGDVRAMLVLGIQRIDPGPRRQLVAQLPGVHRPGDLVPALFQFFGHVQGRIQMSGQGWNGKKEAGHGRSGLRFNQRAGDVAGEITYRQSDQLVDALA
jgi:hypothetical protein